MRTAKTMCMPRPVLECVAMLIRRYQKHEIACVKLMPYIYEIDTLRELVIYFTILLYVAL